MATYSSTSVVLGYFNLLLLLSSALLLFNFASVNATQELNCTPEYGCSNSNYSPKEAVGVKVDYYFLNRKMLFEAQKKPNYYDGELRVVPSGPDPLHHNGGSQKKPNITP